MFQTSSPLLFLGSGDVPLALRRSLGCALLLPVPHSRDPLSYPGTNRTPKVYGVPLLTSTLIILKFPHVCMRLDFLKSLRFNLANTFASDPKFLTDFFEGMSDTVG